MCRTFVFQIQNYVYEHMCTYVTYVYVEKDDCCPIPNSYLLFHVSNLKGT